MLEKTPKLIWLSQYSYLFLLLFLIIVSIFLRVMPAYFVGVEENAEKSVNLQLMDKVNMVVQTQYPHLYPEQQKAMAEQELDNYRKNNPDRIKQLITDQARIDKANFQDPSNQTYLFAIDPWHWYRLTKNYIGHGYEGDIEKNGKYYDTYIYGGLSDFVYRPSSTTKVASFHVFIAGVLYKLVHFFNEDISLLEFLFYLPVLFSALAVIPAFFIGRKFGGNIGGFFTGLIVAFHQLVLIRTIAGLSDTDSYSILFPLLIVWFFIEAFSEDSLKRKLLFIIAAGFMIGLYSFTWVGWWYTFYLMIAGLLLILGYKYIVTFDRKSIGYRDVFPVISSGFKQIKIDVLLSGVFISSSALFVFMLKGLGELKAGFLGPFGFLSIKEISTTNLWPNLFSTVDEFQTVDIVELITFVGSPLFLFISLMGFLLLCCNLKNIKNIVLVGGLSWIGFWMWSIKYILTKDLSNLFFIIPILILVYFMYKHDSELKQEHVFEEDMVYGSYLSASVILLLALYIGIIISLSYLFSNVFLFSLLLTLPFLYIFGIKMICRKKTNNEYKIELEPCFALLFILWFFMTIYASSQAARFLLLIIPPFACGFGLYVHYFITIMIDSCTSLLYLKKGVVKFMVVILFIALLSPAFIEAYTSVKSMTPTITDTWYDSLTYVKEHSSKDAIITSWWDFGHWFKAIADRPVTIDGGTQSAQQVVYIGKLLLTADEKESAGILRLLNCGSYAAYESMEVIFKRDKIKTRDVLDRIILLSKDKAADVLKQEGFTPEQVEKTLEYTHCNPPQSILVVSGDMIDTAYIWSQVGAWDFKRAQVLQYANQNKQREALAFMQKEMNMSEDEANTAYLELKNLKQSQDKNKWVAPQLKYRGTRELCTKKDEMIICQNGINLNFVSNEVYIEQGNKKFYPIAASYVSQDNETFNVLRNQYAVLDDKQKQNPTGTSIFKETDGNYYVYWMDPKLVGSMFNRLYFYNSIGLSCFKHFHTAQFPNRQQEISIWEVNWECLEE